MSPPDYFLAKISFTFAAVVFIARIGWWLVIEAPHALSTNELLFITFVVFGVAAALWVASIKWVDGKQAARENLSQRDRTLPKVPKAEEKPGARLTLELLFTNDFPNTMKATTPTPFVTFNWKNDGSSTAIKAQSYWDVGARAQFVGFFIPSSSHTYEICRALSEDINRFLKQMSKVNISVRTPDQSQLLNEIKFTGRVFLYHESDMTIKERAAIIDYYKAKQLDVEFMGSQYLLNMQIQQGRRKTAN